MITSFNLVSRAYRYFRYQLRVVLNRDTIRAVSEGDSWFQYPILVRDVIDHLSQRITIYSLGAGGATFRGVVNEDEICRALDKTGAKLLFLSAGGMDLIIDGGLAELVHKYEKGRPALEYPNDRFESVLKTLEDQYRKLLKTLARYDGLKIFVHGYDHAIPQRDGPYLGKPLAEQGIPHDLQREVFAHLIDRLNAMMSSLGDGKQVYYVDCRDSAREWVDELHPNNEGFRTAANRFIKQLKAAGETFGKIPTPSGFRRWWGEFTNAVARLFARFGPNTVRSTSADR